MELLEITEKLVKLEKNIVLIYAFNSTGKTRLSVEYKNSTKDNDGNHTGVYYNAFSEDLFYWDNDIDNEEQNISFEIEESSLNQFHSSITEDDIRDKLLPYNPKYDFKFNFYDDAEQGVESISFFRKVDEKIDNDSTIKISRGEERIFVWCFFLALFEAEGWSENQSAHFFIDDPVSSLDDHNIFVTVSVLMELIENNYKNRKIIITTHHIGFFSILADWLSRGEKADKFKNETELLVLSNKNGKINLEKPNNAVFLYHLHLLKTLDIAIKKKEIYAYHFALLRQLLENIVSFLGTPQISFLLEQIGIEEPGRIAQIINDNSHKRVYTLQTQKMVEDNEKLFIEIIEKIKAKYNFRF